MLLDESLDLATRSKSTFLRAQRLQSLFQESFSLIPLRAWLPGLRGENVEHRKEVEKALLQRERELSDFFENALEGIHQVGPDGVILWANKAELKGGGGVTPLRDVRSRV